MPLQDYISPFEEERSEQVEKFLESRWTNVLDEAPVADLQYASDTPSWYARSFSVEDSEVGDPIKVHFNFVMEGLNEAGRQTGQLISGSAVALIDEYDNLEFSDVKAEID